MKLKLIKLEIRIHLVNKVNTIWLVDSINSVIALDLIRNWLFQLLLCRPQKVFVL